MKDLSAKNFGLLIAYVLPGTMTLIGIAAFSTTVSAWLKTPTPVGPSIGGFLFVTLASVAAMKGVQRAYYCPPVQPYMIQASVAFAIAAREAKVESVALRVHAGDDLRHIHNHVNGGLLGGISK